MDTCIVSLLQMNKLKELRLMLGESDPGVSLTVRKYAMVSLIEVFKDIVPGYRLRIPTEMEKAQKVMLLQLDRNTLKKM